MRFIPALISESVIVTPQVHIFKLSAIAFLNLRPRVLTAGSMTGSGLGSGDAGRRDVGEIKDLGETASGGACNAVDSGSCVNNSRAGLNDSESGMVDSTACGVETDV